MIFTDQYGQQWPKKVDPLQIEFNQIRKSWKIHLSGTDTAEQLTTHYLNARKLIWPDRYRHRWTDLIYSQIIKNSITILMGAASSQKTSHASEFNLIDYWVYPDETAVLVSSTTRDKLDDAVWGEMKSLWKAGKDRFPWLAGHMIDYKQRIATDAATGNSEDARDLRKGIFCFPAGTPIDTPTGKRAIESIKIGDFVLNAVGTGRVTHTMNRTAKKLVRIKTTDGREIICTPEHPFFTNHGWTKASELNHNHYLLSVYESMQILRQGHNQQSFLFNCLQREVRNANPGGPGEILYQSTGPKDFCGIIQDARVPSRVGATVTGTAVEKQLHERSQYAGQGSGNVEKKWMENFSAWRKRDWHDCAGEGCYELVPKRPVEFSDKNRSETGERLSGVLQGGYWDSGLQAGDRTGWAFSQFKVPEAAGCEEDKLPYGTWVESIEVSEPASFGITTDSKGRSVVYNIEVDSHPSYSVSGLLVHNCKACYQGKQWVGLGAFAGVKQKRMRFQADETQFMSPTFLSCLPNMRSNVGSGGLKVIASGNPRHDPNDQLGMVAEPLDGWSSMDGIDKTTIWPIKLLGGVCVNLIGIDSPNFDQEKDIYPGLIGHEFEKIMAHDYGKNSPEYETQVMGRMRVGLEHSRVITRQLCRLHQAHEQAMWAGAARVRIYAVDPAYGGGDRCIGGWIEFGESATGQQILRVNPPRILKIVVNPDYPPEDQIADLVKADLAQNDIPPENCFYDSFGKGTVGFAFARKFGANPPVPVDAGARPTQRPVRYDLWVTEKDGRKRLKRCDEHYDRFITELWFSVRETIESRQMRELPESTMLEGCWREYETVAGDRIAIETKDDLKERMGKSPDEFDWLAIACEGARRLGFKIKRLGGDVAVEGGTTWDWLDTRQKKSEEFRSRHSLTF